MSSIANRSLFALAIIVLAFSFSFLQQNRLVQEAERAQALKSVPVSCKEEQQHTELHNLTKTLAQNEETISTMEREFEEMNANITDLLKQLQDLKDNVLPEDSSSSATLPPASSNHSSVFAPHEICSILPSESFTATRLWQQNLPRIIDASKNPLIPELLTDEEDAKMHKLLEEMLPPSRLRRAVRHIPTFSHSIVKNVMEIIQKRIQDPAKNPPLRVAVFGGSVTSGRHCFHPRGNADFACAWPQRLELLINQFSKMEIIKVYNLGIGGTSTTVGTINLKYWMYPEELSKAGPDVIINSYSTNDSLPSWELKPGDDFVTHIMDQARDLLQPFVREALQLKECKEPPLVVHVDDYLGPQQKQLLGELSYVAGMTQVAKWYDTMAISYGEVVRDLFYKDNTDPTFGNKKDVHYGHWAHQTIAWSVGFASMELLSTYCDDEYRARTVTETKSRNNPDGGYATNGTMAEKKALVLPPLLTRDIQLYNATAEFIAARNTAEQSFANMNCENRPEGENEESQDPCIVSFIAAPGGYDAAAINRFMQTHKSTEIDGWKVENNMAEGWGNKIGWIAEKANATFSLKFDDIAKDVKTVTLYFLRSYGDKWKDSRAKITISRLEDSGAKTLWEEEISGVFEDQNYTYSLTLPHTMNLPEPILKGGNMGMNMTLISGSHFKMMGLMLCNK